MKYALRLAVLCWAALLPACKGEPPAPSGMESGVDHSQLCKEGGAALNTSTNECVCAVGQRWNGIRCESESASKAKTAAKSAPVGQELNDDGTHESAAIQPRTGEAEPAAAKSAVAGDARVALACKRAKGAWLEMEGFCRCPSNKVLVGHVCRTLPGHATDDACLYAVHKGKWHGGDCDCPAGRVFAPARGGCMPRMHGDVTVLRRECESSLNNGRWDAARDRCRCPTGRIWLDELCQVQQELSSAGVCESEYNGGKWDGVHKRCACPVGSVWLDQTCRSPHGVGPETLCESEANGGHWNVATMQCDCGGKGRWDGEAMACRD